MRPSVDFVITCVYEVLRRCTGAGQYGEILKNEEKLELASVSFLCNIREKEYTNVKCFNNNQHIKEYK